MPPRGRLHDLCEGIFACGACRPQPICCFFMSSNEHPFASVQAEVRQRARRMKWILSGSTAILVITGVSAWYGLRQLRASQLQEVLVAAHAHMDANDMAESARLLGEAQRAAPQNPGVIRATADFLIRANANPQDIAQTLKRVTELPDAATEDLLKLARAEAKQGALQAARATLQRLPESERSGAEALELEATMLKLEGRHQEADERLRASLLAAPDKRESMLKLAVLDYKQPLPALHRRGRNGLWQIAEGSDQEARLATQLLVKDLNLTGPEAARLVDLAEKQPGAESLRLATLSIFVRLHPHERAAIIARETTRAASATGEERKEFSRWLSSVDEHEKVLQALPKQTKGMPADQLELRFESLAAAGRWGEVEALLTRDTERSVGAVFFNLWHALLAAGKGDGQEVIRQHLGLAFDATGRGDKAAAALKTAEAADRLDMADLAGAFYEEIADKQKASTPNRAALLEKAFAQHAEARKTSAMLSVARQVAELSPNNRPAAFRADYLALLVGESLEVVADKTRADTRYAAGERVLLQALAAHRLRLPMPDTVALKALKTASLPAGQRAVLAAMIATTGDAAAAFEIAERVSHALLLPEEARLLTLAR